MGCSSCGKRRATTKKAKPSRKVTVTLKKGGNTRKRK